MPPIDFIPDADDLAILAFRLAWPGETVSRPAEVIRRRKRRLPQPARAGLVRLIPAKLRARLAARRQPLHGWPIALSAPGPESERSWLPSVKLTGRPLD